MRRPVIAGNWKMYKTQAEARAYFAAFAPLVAGVDALRHHRRAAVHGACGVGGSGEGNRDFHRRAGYALGTRRRIHRRSFRRDAGGGGMPRRHHCAIPSGGNSSARPTRRANKKVKAALAAGLTPILCVGETLAEREAGKTEEVLERQFRGGVAALTGAEFSRIILAYEPVWAIGTGRTATPEMAAEAHRFLRQQAAAVLRRNAPPDCGSSTAAASNPTTSRG